MGKPGGSHRKRTILKSGDPRKAGGGIAGPMEDPHARDSVIVNTELAVLMDHVSVSTVETGGDGEAVAMALAGRINRSPERTEILYLFGEDGAAAIITELLALAGRGGWRERLMKAVEERIDSLVAEGNLDARMTVEDVLQAAVPEADDPRWG